MRTVGLCRGLFAIAFAGLAIMSLAYRDFAPMWHAVPAWIPLREVWICGFSIFLLAASVGLCFPLAAARGTLMIVIGAYDVVWAIIATPPIFSNPLSVGAWYGVCEALTSLTGVWILYTLLRWSPQRSNTPIAVERSVRVARVLFGLTCVFYGYSHFAYADYTASIVPSWLGAGLVFAYLTGAGHIAAGIGIVIGILPRLAAALEAIMVSLFGLLVWVPSFWAQPRPSWATPPQTQWSELVVTLVVAAAAWVVAFSWPPGPRHRGLRW
jgi:uncharacterized membrane protein YphA (DoxX/SURF4 family)